MFGKLRQPRYHVETWNPFLDYPLHHYDGADLDKAMKVFVEEALLGNSIRKDNDFSFKHTLLRGKTVLMVDEYEFVPPLFRTTYV
jgi:hypothetical protein